MLGDSTDPGRLRLIGYDADANLYVRGTAQVAAVVEWEDDVRIENGARVFGSLLVGDDLTFLNDARAHLDVNLPSIGPAGPAAQDDTGTNNGTHRNGVLLGQAGQVDQAARMDGADDFVEVPHKDQYLLERGTVGFWFRADDPSSRQGLVSKDASGHGDGGHLTIFLNNSRVRARLSSASAGYQLSSPPVAADTWHHVAFTWGAGGMNLYLNGAAVRSDSYVGGLGSTSGGLGNREPMVFGVDTRNSAQRSAAGWSNPFSGLIDDVRLYNGTLDANQVANLHAGQPIGPSTGPTVVMDTSDFGTPLDLAITETGKTQWLTGGGLEVQQSTKIVSPGPATKLHDALTATDQITLELIFTPQNLTQSGPARIVSYSSSTATRNFTFGQMQQQYTHRLRTTTTSANGVPAPVSGAVLTTGQRHHVVVTYDGEEVQIYRNGLLETTQDRTGTFNWTSMDRFMLANEESDDRLWLGRLYRLALYDRALNAVQAADLFAGLSPGSGKLAYGLRWDEQPD